MTGYPVQKFLQKTVVVDTNWYVAKEFFPIDKFYYNYVDKIILSNGLIIDRTEKIAQEITRDYYNKDLLMLVIMNGAVKFGSVLSQKITEILRSDIANYYSMNICVEYIDIKSYVDDKSTGDVKIRIDEKIKQKIKNNNVLIVEDIYDSGNSLYHLYNLLNTFEPLSLRSVVLLQKMNTEHLKYNLEIDYLCFLIPNEFVIGFGLDFNDQFRQLNHLCVISKEGIDKFKSK